MVAYLSVLHHKGNLDDALLFEWLSGSLNQIADKFQGMSDLTGAHNRCLATYAFPDCYRLCLPDRSQMLAEIHTWTLTDSRLRPQTNFFRQTGTSRWRW